jgi:hypothetical protein
MRHQADVAIELCGLAGSAARPREIMCPPVDGGPARDLRAAANTAGSARQLTGLCATAHRPDARAQLPRRNLSSRSRDRKRSPTRSLRASVSAVEPCGQGVLVDCTCRIALSITGHSEVARSAKPHGCGRPDSKRGKLLVAVAVDRLCRRQAITTTCPAVVHALEPVRSEKYRRNQLTELGSMSIQVA